MLHQSLALDPANLAVLKNSCSILGSNTLLSTSLLSLSYVSMVRISTFLSATHSTFDRTHHLNFDDNIPALHVHRLSNGLKHTMLTLFEISILCNNNCEICAVTTFKI